MIVSKNSWHYRLNNWMESGLFEYKQQNYTLCKYFWTTVLSLIKVMTGVVFATILSCGGLFVLWFLVINPILAWVTLMAGIEVGWVKYNIMYSGIALLLLFLITVGLNATINGKIKVVPEWINTTKRRSTPPKQPSLLWSWLKAKKDKVCPFIEFK